MKRSSLMARRASMALNSFRAEVSPQPSRSCEPRLRAAVALGKREDVRRRLDQPIVVEDLDVLLAKSLDVEGVARHEMLEPLGPLRRADQAAGAAPDHILLAGGWIDLAHGVAAAGRADRGKAESLGALRPLLFNDAENLRNDVAGALDDHRVADAHVLARDLVLVVQRGVLHDDAADGDRLELGDRRQRAGAADLDLDVAEDGGRLLGGEFVGDGPARRARDEAEALLQIEAVDLVDDAVDVVAEPGALALDVAVGVEHLLHGGGELRQRVERKAPICQRPIDAPLGVGRELRRLAPGIGEEVQRARRGDGGIELAQRAGRGVARIGEGPLAALRLPVVEALEGGAAI